MKIKNTLFIILIMVFVFAICGCEDAKLAPSPVQTTQVTTTAANVTPSPASSTPTRKPTPIKTTPPDVPLSTPHQAVLPSESPVPAKQSETVSHEAGTVRVRPGDTLERDIIPRLCDVFSLSETKVKSILEGCKGSKLINEDLSDFRRMEGIMLPGKYEIIEDKTLLEYVNIWITQAEERYDTLAIGDMNDLVPHEQLSLAAIIEWECLPNAYYDEVAAAFLNRLDDGAKLRSCATTEYALGYTRPYLTSDDIKIRSPYNTYYTRDLPIGPICAVEDECLRSAIGKKTNSSLYYFFNDYARREILSFSSYNDFKAAAVISRELYDETYDIDPYAKVDKKDVFGYAQ